MEITCHPWSINTFTDQSYCEDDCEDCEDDCEDECLECEDCEDDCDCKFRNRDMLTDPYLIFDLI